MKTSAKEQILMDMASINDDTSIAFLLENDILDESSVSKIFDMKIKNAVNNVHNHRISCGGEGKRWFTRVNDPITGKYIVIAGKAEEELYTKLYDFYFGEKVQLQKRTILDYYPEWLKMKMSTDIKSNTAKRYDQDFNRYYKDEPLSKEIIETPVTKLKTSTLKTWAYQMIQKHNMSRRQYGNCTLIINQLLDYLVEQEILSQNVFKNFRIKKSVFRRVDKKPAETQIFYDQERSDIIRLSMEKAISTRDETFLAIPLMFLTGLRIDECLALSFSDFDQDAHSLYVHASIAVVEKQLPDGSWETRSYEYKEYLKGNSDTGTIDIPDACFELLDQIHEIHNSKGIDRDRLFEVKTPNNIQMKLYRICDELGIPRRSPHKERKTYISTLINNGADIDYVRTQARHKDLNTTMKSYVYSTLKKDEKVALLNSLL